MRGITASCRTGLASAFAGAPGGAERLVTTRVKRVRFPFRIQYLPAPHSRAGPSPVPMAQQVDKLKKKAADFEAKRQVDKAISTYLEIFKLWDSGKEGPPDV